MYLTIQMKGQPNNHLTINDFDNAVVFIACIACIPFSAHCQ